MIWAPGPADVSAPTGAARSCQVDAAHTGGHREVLRGVIEGESLARTSAAEVAEVPLRALIASPDGRARDRPAAKRPARRLIRFMGNFDMGGPLDRAGPIADAPPIVKKCTTDPPLTPPSHHPDIQLSHPHRVRPASVLPMPTPTAKWRRVITKGWVQQRSVSPVNGAPPGLRRVAGDRCGILRYRWIVAWNVRVGRSGP